MSDDKEKVDTLTALKKKAQELRNSAAIPLWYIKGKWVANDKELNGTELIARPEWITYGWRRLWDGRVTDYHIGYIADDYDPPAREALGDHDKDEWAIYCKGYDPWRLQYSLPLYHPVSGEAYLWSTNSKGGEAAIGDLLEAYTTRIELKPEDGTTEPRVVLNSDGYNHKNGFWVDTPQPDIVGWVKPPPTPRPPLPAPPPLPSALPSPTSAPAIEDSSPKDSSPADSPFNDQIPFVLAFFIAIAWLVNGGGTLIA
jgi:hypothetical protein